MTIEGPLSEKKVLVELPAGPTTKFALQDKWKSNPCSGSSFLISMTPWRRTTQRRQLMTKLMQPKQNLQRKKASMAPA